MNSLDLRLPDDFHLHLRQGAAMAGYAARSAERFGRFLVMPNLSPPVSSGRAVADYASAIRSALAAAARDASLVMSFKLLPGMTANTVADCAKAGALVGKYYPAGATTNSADGIADPGDAREALAAMEELGLVLSIHGEDPEAAPFERERAFLPVVDRLVAGYPRLRVVLEHLSGAEAVEAVRAWPDRVAATLTAHHLAFTVEDMLADRLDSALYCKPVLKTPRDREALVAAAVSGSPKFFFGSDSAPHSPAAKAAGAAGSYTAPVALSLLAEVFEDAGALPRLEAFVSEFGARFYGLGLNSGRVRLSREAWTVPDELDGARPVAAGRPLRWSAGRLPG